MKRSKKIMIGLLALVAVDTIAITYRMVSSSKSHIGIDVSHHNHLSGSDWDKLKEKGVSFVYIKVSEGGHYQDPQAEHNSVMAASRMMLIGTYHFFLDNVKSEKQLHNFLAARGRCSWNLMPVIDYEADGFHPSVSEHSRQATLIKLYHLLERHDGRAPIIYCSIFEYLKLKRTLPKAKFWVGDPNFGFGTIRQEKKAFGNDELDFDQANLKDIIFLPPNS